MKMKRIQEFNEFNNNSKEEDYFIMMTDGYPCGSWGDSEYCDTTWIIHGDPNPNPPFGAYAIYDDHKK